MEKIGFSFWGVFLVITLLAPPMIGAQEVVERLPSGVINWTQGVVTAKGSGAPPTGITIPSQARLMAERAAKADALRNLLESIKGVRVDSETTVESYTTKSDRVMTRVSGIVIGARVLETRYLSDGAVEVTVACQPDGRTPGGYAPGTAAPYPAYDAAPCNSSDRQTDTASSKAKSRQFRKKRDLCRSSSPPFASGKGDQRTAAPATSPAASKGDQRTSHLTSTFTSGEGDQRTIPSGGGNQGFEGS